MSGRYFRDRQYEFIKQYDKKFKFFRNVLISSYRAERVKELQGVYILR